MQNKVETIQKPVSLEKNPLFPVFLKLEQLHVLLVGGGKVALEKLNALLTNAPGVQVRLVSITISQEIRAIAAIHPGLTLIQKPFGAEDLEKIDIVVIAINDKRISHSIRDVAKEQKLLVNVADTPELCDFYLGAIVQKGNLKIAISTNGKSPTAAKRIKEVLQQALPDQLDNVIDNLHAIRNKLNGNFEYKVKKLNELTQGLVDKDGLEKSNRWRKIATYSLLSFALMLVGHFIFSYLPFQTMADDATTFYKTLDKNFHWMVLAGFLAQLVDGALGMGYGVTSATILLSAGVNLASISGSIHTAEMFASGASGYSHYKFGNVNKKLFKALIIPGVIGAVLGAILLSKFGQTQAQYLRPVMAAYTLFLGIRILINAFRAQKATKKFKRHGLLAGVGGFLDSFGGGG
ncbi:MAG TPA: TSUP family transporter, partial [Flavitalea sp.]|nr:TSUP family transporter [Flavitalea sp.]